jgi:hypothetical protein
MTLYGLMMYDDDDDDDDDDQGLSNKLKYLTKRFSVTKLF